MLYVPPLDPAVLVPRKQMEIFLLQEAPHFLRTILDVTLPKVEGRIGIPIIETRNKMRAQDRRRSPLEQFILECCYPVPGARILFAEFCDRFIEWLPVDETSRWSKTKIGRDLPPEYPAGVLSENKRYIGNLSWEATISETESRPWIAVEGRLKLK